MRAVVTVVFLTGTFSQFLVSDIRWQAGELRHLIKSARHHALLFVPHFISRCPAAVKSTSRSRLLLFTNVKRVTQRAAYKEKYNNEQVTSGFDCDRVLHRRGTCTGVPARIVSQPVGRAEFRQNKGKPRMLFCFKTHRSHKESASSLRRGRFNGEQ